jgi:hypothetical protein
MGGTLREHDQNKGYHIGNRNKRKKSPQPKAKETRITCPFKHVQSSLSCGAPNYLGEVRTAIIPLKPRGYNVLKLFCNAFP